MWDTPSSWAGLAARPRTRAIRIYAMPWEKKERGWATGPDDWSLHFSPAEYGRFTDRRLIRIGSPLWVKSGHGGVSVEFPVYPR